MHRVFNFSAGPAMLPDEVMQQAQEEFMDWHDLGVSVMEISHRGKPFKMLAEESVQDCRDILNIPDNYHVLFLAGGARSQFAMIPMNLLDHGKYKKAAYVQTGVWSQIAIAEAKRFCEVDILADSENTRFTTIPEKTSWQSLDKHHAYLHYVDNETINGVEFPYIPESNDLPLISDMSSNIFSRPFDINQFGLVYACAQKNVGPAGITLVIIRDDLAKRVPLETTPSMFRYALQIENNSMLNTCPTYSWYMASLVLKWIKRQGGLEALAKINQKKAEKLYHYIDQTDFYTNPVDQRYRSRMNVIFTLPEKSLDEIFVKQAEKVGLYGLKGHRFLGGIRASIYNAMPEKGVDALIEFMKTFEKENG